MDVPRRGRAAGEETSLNASQKVGALLGASLCWCLSSFHFRYRETGSRTGTVSGLTNYQGGRPPSPLPPRVAGQIWGAIGVSIAPHRFFEGTAKNVEGSASNQMLHYVLASRSRPKQERGAHPVAQLLRRQELKKNVHSERAGPVTVVAGRSPALIHANRRAKPCCRPSPKFFVTYLSSSG
jgi:hypothetical protein